MKKILYAINPITLNICYIFLRKEAAKETMYLTNIVPEVKNNFFWNRLEEHCRDNLTEVFETVYVISGTLFRPNDESPGKAKLVTYQVS